jgi:CRISPR-associated exonuclease Cas4
LGISGQADVTEFRATGSDDPDGVTLDGKPGRWRPSPVEYKRGKPKRQICDRVQVCAQGLCLEEMFGITIPGGVLFYATPRRRQEVPFTTELRQKTEQLCERMRELYGRRETPAPVYTRACERCSLQSLCLPCTLAAPRDVRAYLAGAMKE